jgi:hypothetical protein
MRNFILMWREAAQQKSDDELAEAIAVLESGKKNLRLPDEDGRLMPLNPIIVAVYRREQEDRAKRKKESGA